jgi:hypothetical protein
MYLFAVSSGCLKIDAMASPIVSRLVPVQGSFPESKIVAVFLGSEKPREPTLSPYISVISGISDLYSTVVWYSPSRKTYSKTRQSTRIPRSPPQLSSSGPFVSVS